jgi:hypothetical protein
MRLGSFFLIASTPFLVSARGSTIEHGACKNIEGGRNCQDVKERCDGQTCRTPNTKAETWLVLLAS